MIRRSQPATLRPPSHISIPASVSPGSRSAAYGRPFWMAYVSNTLLMVGVSLLYRYADFVTLLGGTELHLGWIVGVGMVGSLAMRLTLGVGIDRYGPRMVWVGSSVLLVVTCLAHLAIFSCHGPAIYLLRIIYCCALAGVFGASMTFVSSRVPLPRVAEMVGMLGTAGFLGTVLGTQLGDYLLASNVVLRPQIDAMFVMAALLGGGSLVFAFLATHGQIRPTPSHHPPLTQLIARYHPGIVILVGVAMGVGLGLPGTFLRTYAVSLDIPRIGVFFGIYAPAAIITRILTRRLPERFGNRPMILAGVGGMVLSQLSFLWVGAEWQLVIPGIGYGISHAVLFPSVVAAGCRLFPDQHRGLGTTLMLGTWDAGQLVGAPLAGAIVHYSGFWGLPGYATMFVIMSGVLAAVGVAYLVNGRPRELPRQAVPEPHHDRVLELPVGSARE